MAPIWSVIANRKDKANQSFWTEYRKYAVDGCPANPGDLVMLNEDGKIASCFLPPNTGLTIEINGVASPCQDVLNFIPGTGITITYEPDCGYLFTATGTTACGSAAFLCTDIVGTEVEVDISHPTHPGQLLISQPGNTSAVWADPQVQGLYPAGSTICPAPPYEPPTCINPVLIGGQGESPSGKDGLLHPLPLSSIGLSVTTLQNPQEALNEGYTDPYQRARVSTPVTLFEESYEFFPVGPIPGAEPLTQFTLLTTGSGLVQRPAAYAQILMTVGGDAGARAVWQTKTYFISQLGKGFGIITGGNLGVNTANVITRIGAYDDDHGGFFEQNGVTGTLRVVFRTNAVDTGIDQANWNIDKLDGTGFSGVTLNMAMGQEFVIDVGAARIRFGFIVNGVTYYCHAISVSNLVPNIVNSQSIVPVRFEILNAGASAGGATWQSNLVVLTDSGFQDNPTSFAFSVNTGTTLKPLVASTPTPILSIRPKLLLNGHTNRSYITLTDFGVFSQGQIIQYQLIWGGTLTGASFNSASNTSAVEYDLSATSVTGGHVVDSGFVAAFSKDTVFAQDTFPFRLPFTLDITGTVQDTYTLVVAGVNTQASVAGSFKWQENR
jgi:hypothetical protein